MCHIYLQIERKRSSIYKSCVEINLHFMQFLAKNSFRLFHNTSKPVKSICINSTLPLKLIQVHMFVKKVIQEFFRETNTNIRNVSIFYSDVYLLVSRVRRYAILGFSLVIRICLLNNIIICLSIRIEEQRDAITCL